jgi:hypothetical protein
MVGAALLHLDHREVIALMPEPIIKQDGTSNNDWECNAAKRLIAKLRQDHPHLHVMVTEDSLSSNALHLNVLREHSMHDMLGVKEGDHAYLFAQVTAADQVARVTYDDRDDQATGLRHRFRFVRDMPLNASHTDVRVNFLECWEWDRANKVQHFSWVTDLCVTQGPVYQLMRGGRARWRNETPRSKLRGIRRKRRLSDYAASCGESHPARD